jgi:hypothetical protein
MKQWHPIFAQLLRPAVEAYYEVQTTVPVGDAPRQADFVLLRRTVQTAPPFQGLWRHLTSWNILEFKGPSVSPRRGDIELLIELGLGIDRRLRRKERRRMLPEEVSFWYVANRSGAASWPKWRRRSRLWSRLARVCGAAACSGVCYSAVICRWKETAFLCTFIGREPPATEREVARLVAAQPALQPLYGVGMLALHPMAWQEVEAMARATGKHCSLIYGRRSNIWAWTASSSKSASIASSSRSVKKN